jgi:hypothetical protein
LFLFLGCLARNLAYTLAPSALFLTTYPVMKNLERARAIQVEHHLLAVVKCVNLFFFTLLQVGDLAVSIVMDHDSVEVMFHRHFLYLFVQVLNKNATCYPTTPRPVNIITACKTPALAMWVPLIFNSLIEVKVVSITRDFLVLTNSLLYMTKYRTVQVSMQEMLITLDHIISTKFFLRSKQTDRETIQLVRMAILPTTSP